MSLLTVGSVAFDAIETPFGKTDKIIGGAGTYIALAAAFYKNEQNIVSVVGEDFPKEMLEELRNRNVNLDGLQIKEGEKNILLVRSLPQRYELTRHLGDRIECIGAFRSNHSCILPRQRLPNVGEFKSAGATPSN